MLLDFGSCPNCPDDFDGDGDVTRAYIDVLLLKLRHNRLRRPAKQAPRPSISN